LITDAFPDRRKTMYGELERKKAPTYQQITSICLGEVKLLIERLQIGLNPTYSPAPMTDSKPSVQPVNLVPQISQPLRNDKQIAALPPAPSSRWEHIEAATSGIAKLHSTPGNAQQAYGRDVINKGAKKVQEGTQQAETLVTQYYNKLMSSYLGRPFRYSLQRTTKLVVLGAPYSRISLICNAVTALTNLTTFSIKCDELGRFNQGVPDIIRVFTMAIKMIDEYMAKVPIHWSDHAALNKPEAERKIVPEVEHVRECLRDGLEKIIGSFNEYLSSMGLSALEILDAKKAVGVSKAPEILMSGAQG
jgi:nucleoporin NDC1